jgi:hypothetical protein
MSPSILENEGQSIKRKRVQKKALKESVKQKFWQKAVLATAIANPFFKHEYCND